MTYVTCRLTAKNRDQVLNPALGSRVWANLFTPRIDVCCPSVRPSARLSHAVLTRYEARDSYSRQQVRATSYKSQFHQARVSGWPLARKSLNSPQVARRKINDVKCDPSLDRSDVLYTTDA